MNKNVYSKLKEVRKSRNMSIEEVAVRCGVSGQTVRNLENGTSVNPVVLSLYLSLAKNKDRAELLNMITERGQ